MECGIIYIHIYIYISRYVARLLFDAFTSLTERVCFWILFFSAVVKQGIIRKVFRYRGRVFIYTNGSNKCPY